MFSKALNGRPYLLENDKRAATFVTEPFITLYFLNRNHTSHHAVAINHCILCPPCANTPTCTDTCNRYTLPRKRKKETCKHASRKPTNTDCDFLSAANLSTTSQRSNYSTAADKQAGNRKNTGLYNWDQLWTKPPSQAYFQLSVQVHHRKSDLSGCIVVLNERWWREQVST